MLPIAQYGKNLRQRLFKVCLCSPTGNAKPNVVQAGRGGMVQECWSREEIC